MLHMENGGLMFNRQPPTAAPAQNQTDHLTTSVMTNKRSPKSRKIHSANPRYKNPDVPAAHRVKDLLARMTLEEKAAQMVCVWQQKKENLVDDQGRFAPAKARLAFRKGHGLGQVGRPSDAGSPPGEPWKGQTARGMAELTNAIQKFFLENTRLGIPVIFHEECLHGHAGRDPTSLPRSLPRATFWAK